MVKCIDRCNNVSGMALGFTPERVKKYVKETEEWYPRLLRVVKAVPGIQQCGVASELSDPQRAADGKEDRLNSS